MLDVSRVARDRVKSLFFSYEWKRHRAGLVSGGAACGAEVAGHPVVESPPVRDESRKAADEWPYGRTGELTGEEMKPNEIGENENEVERGEGEKANDVVGHWIRWRKELVREEGKRVDL